MNNNRLSKEKSPYLLQHANNPVDWYPWNNEAFDKAREKDQPIFLSIGYSTCHWCHVMEHESFENDEVAKMMNDVFVSIKVDREERPDIDNIYMRVCQLITGHGGWPLTIIMTPDKKPFFAGTYFPKTSHGNRIGMIDLINRVKEIWHNDREKINESTASILSALTQSHLSSNESQLNESILETAQQQFIQRYDRENGGFGTAPKFPSPHNLIFLLNMYRYSKNEEALSIVKHTLQEMRKGGIFDHIGLGFHRYSTDQHWLLPHFEKMLYDQAMLIIAYTDAYQITKDEFYKNVAEEIIEYVSRDMTSKEGAFFSAEDADSEGVEGKFYVWSYAELQSLLLDDDYKILVKFYNIEPNGNFTDEATRHQSQFNILHQKQSVDQLASTLNIDKEFVKKSISDSRKLLFAEREKRVHPLKDDKVLTDWNGLMIAALAKAGRTFDNKEYIASAEKATEFILSNMVYENGRLIHRYRGGECEHQANLDDYAFLCWGLLELYQTTFEINLLKRAISLTQILLEHFWDNENGGFFFTPDYGEELLIRHKDLYDGAIPSGNSVQLHNLIRLNKITANQKYSEYAERLISSFSNNVKQSPSAYSHFLSGYLTQTQKSSEIVIVGNNYDNEVKDFLNIINQKNDPNSVVILVNEKNKNELVNLIPYIKGYMQIESKPTVYVCQDYECKLPVNNIDELKKIID